MWIATPSSYRTCTDYSCRSPGALRNILYVIIRPSPPVTSVAAAACGVLSLWSMRTSNSSGSPVVRLLYCQKLPRWLAWSALDHWSAGRSLRSSYCFRLKGG